MSNYTDSTSRSISLRSSRSLSKVENSLVSRGLQDLADLTAAPSSMLSVPIADIHAAATEGDIEAVRRILNADPAKVDANDDDGWAPLHCAVCYDHPRIVELLLTRAANRDARLRGGERRIREAMGDRQQFLFYMDVFSGATPLHLAALLGRDACACHLLPAADVGMTDDDGYQPLHYAAGPPHWLGLGNDASTALVAERLVACGADINATSIQSGITPAHIAAGNGHIDMLLCLLRHGVNVDSRDSRQWTPLHHGAAHAHSDVLGLLLENGALVDAIARDSVTPILVAAGSGDAQTVRTLLEHGALISQSDDSGRTALHWASESGSRETAEVLLEYGTDVDARGRDGCSPLHVAANCCEDEGVHIVELIECLLSNGADVNVSLSKIIEG